MKKFIILILFFTAFNGVIGQNTMPDPKDGYVVYYQVMSGDTLAFIPLPEVSILPPKVFKSQKEEVKYKKLVRNLKKVLPFAKVANTRLFVIEKNMEKISDPKLQKEYLKLEEEKLKVEFKDDIQNMTFTQGKLLIKLIDRETGHTSYELIKELRGSFSAFLYQGIATLFGEDLKEGYDPNGEDKLIEEILIRIENGEL